MAERAENPVLGRGDRETVRRREYYAALRHASIGPGNADGGRTTSRKNRWALLVNRTIVISDHQAGRRADLVAAFIFWSGGTVNRASAPPYISDNAEIAELIACRLSHVILFSTGAARWWARRFRR